VAQKEYQIKVTLDQIENDLNSCQLNYAPFGDSGSHVFVEIDQDILVFKDAEVKVTTVAQN
jgi:hypothetical protein